MFSQARDSAEMRERYFAISMQNPIFVEDTRIMDSAKRAQEVRKATIVTCNLLFFGRCNTKNGNTLTLKAGLEYSARRGSYIFR